MMWPWSRSAAAFAALCIFLLLLLAYFIAQPGAYHWSGPAELHAFRPPTSQRPSPTLEVTALPFAVHHVAASANPTVTPAARAQCSWNDPAALARVAAAVAKDDRAFVNSSLARTPLDLAATQLHIIVRDPDTELSLLPLCLDLVSRCSSCIQMSVWIAEKSAGRLRALLADVAVGPSSAELKALISEARIRIRTEGELPLVKGAAPEAALNPAAILLASAAAAGPAAGIQLVMAPTVLVVHCGWFEMARHAGEFGLVMPHATMPWDVATSVDGVSGWLDVHAPGAAADVPPGLPAIPGRVLAADTRHEWVVTWLRAWAAELLLPSTTRVSASGTPGEAAALTRVLWKMASQRTPLVLPDNFASHCTDCILQADHYRDRNVFGAGYPLGQAVLALDAHGAADAATMKRIGLSLLGLGPRQGAKARENPVMLLEDLRCSRLPLSCPPSAPAASASSSLPQPVPDTSWPSLNLSFSPPSSATATSDGEAGGGPEMGAIAVMIRPKSEHLEEMGQCIVLLRRCMPCLPVLVWVDVASAGRVTEWLAAKGLADRVHVHGFEPRPIGDAASARAVYRMVDYYRLEALLTSPFRRSVYLDVDIWAVGCAFLAPLERLVARFGLIYSFSSRTFASNAERNGDLNIGSDIDHDLLARLTASAPRYFPMFNNGLVFFDREHPGARAFVQQAARVTGLYPARGQSLLLYTLLRLRPPDFQPLLLPEVYLTGQGLTARRSCVRVNGSDCRDTNMAFQHKSSKAGASDAAERYKPILAAAWAQARNRPTCPRPRPDMSATIRDNATPKSQPDTLLLVAHSDDEVIWPAQDLLAGDNARRYAVVIFHVPETMSNRRQESLRFLSAIHVPDVTILKFPDCEVGETRLHCPPMPAAMRAELRAHLRRRDWARVITHGASGEYGHIQHKDLHQAVVAELGQAGKLDRLHTFQVSDTLRWPSDDPLYEQRFYLLTTYFASRGANIHKRWGTMFESLVVPYHAFNATAARLVCLHANFAKNVMEC